MTLDALLKAAAMDARRREIEAGARYAGYDVPSRRSLRAAARLRVRFRDRKVLRSSPEPRIDVVVDNDVVVQLETGVQT